MSGEGFAEGLTRLGRPQAHRLVETCRSQRIAGGAEGHAPHLVFVPSEGFAEGLSCLGGPQANGLVVAGGGQPVAGGVEGHAKDAAHVPSEGIERLAGLGGPQAYGLVVAGGGQGIAGGAEGDAQHILHMLSEGSTEGVARFHRPEPYRLIETCRSQECTVVAEGHTSHRARVSGEFPDV